MVLNLAFLIQEKQEVSHRERPEIFAHEPRDRDRAVLDFAVAHGQ